MAKYLFKFTDPATSEEPTSKATTEMVDEWDAWIQANGITITLQFHSITLYYSFYKYSRNYTIFKNYYCKLTIVNILPDLLAWDMLKW